MSGWDYAEPYPKQLRVDTLVVNTSSHPGGMKGCKAVSYTHLDVYKRQVVFSLFCLAQFTSRESLTQTATANMKLK